MLKTFHGETEVAWIHPIVALMPRLSVVILLYTLANFGHWLYTWTWLELSSAVSGQGPNHTTITAPPKEQLTGTQLHKMSSKKEDESVPAVVSTSLNGVTTLRMNRPRTLNSWTKPMMDTLFKQMRKIADDPGRDSPIFKNNSQLGFLTRFLTG
jgi:hypothetical protein